MKSVILLVLSIITASVYAAADSISIQRQQDLREIVIQDCGSCHGLTLKGGLGPALLAQNLEQKPAEYVSAVILDGISNTAMPAWRPLISPLEAGWIAEQLKQGKIR